MPKFESFSFNGVAWIEKTYKQTNKHTAEHR